MPTKTSDADSIHDATSDDIELISIVVPLYNEEGNIRPLYEGLLAEIERLPYSFELVFVDDGSSDRSAELVRELCADDWRVRLIGFSRNFGKQSAITAGLEHAQGDAVIMMDADLQHPPSVVPKLIAKWKEGFEVVYTIREPNRNAGLWKRVTSALFYRVFNRIVQTRVKPEASDFRLMDRRVVKCLNSLEERTRFFRGLVAWTGFRQIGIPAEVPQRHSGQTKFSFLKLVGLAIDGFTSFTTVPLRISMALGFLAAVAGVPYAIWAVYVRLFTETNAPGWASTIVAVLFLGGVQLICLGILGEYVGRIYEEVKSRPPYIVREYAGFETQPTLERRTIQALSPELTARCAKREPR